MIELVKSSVVFNEEDHTYMLGDIELHGITEMIKRQIFPDKYKDVPKATLDKAAKRGTAIHHECEFVDRTGFAPDSPEAMNYMLIRSSEGFSPLANEYTVSDNEYFASNIDCVWERNGKVSLADIKTTYRPDKPYLQWQLSIYAYLFEMQNPTLKVDNIYGVWLRGEKSELILLERLPDEQVKKLLKCEMNGEHYPLFPTSAKDKGLQLIPEDVIYQFKEANKEMEQINNFIEGFKDTLLRAMKDHSVKSWELDDLKTTVVFGGPSKTFDTKKFQSEHPDLYNEYLKETIKKDSIRITLK